MWSLPKRSRVTRISIRKKRGQEETARHAKVRERGKKKKDERRNEEQEKKEMEKNQWVSQ